MNRICLMTWFSGTNFGTLLQAYALSRKLSDIGYAVTLPVGVAERYSFKHYLILFCSYIGITQVKDYLEGRNRMPKLFKKRVVRFNRWRKRNLNTKRCSYVFQTRALQKTCGFFISGSDQIWNTFFSFDPAMFLSFAGTKKKIAYASSIGTNSINPKYAKEVKTLLSSFDYIGVREKTGVEVLQDLTGRKDIAVVVDPTLLLSRDEWITVTNAATVNVPQEPYILCYLIGNNKHYNNYVQNVRKKTGIGRVLWIPAQESPDLHVDNAECVSDIDPFDFVALLNGAAHVCTDSFHATAFAINLQKEFTVLLRFDDGDRYSQNSRIYDLLNTYRLIDRVYRPDAWEDTSCRINYSGTENVLRNLRLYSIGFLKSALANERLV